MPVTVCNTEMEPGRDMKKYGRTDQNQTELVRNLRKAGCNVLSLASVGDGCPDLLVYRNATGLLTMLEVKNPNQPPSKRRLTPHQIKFREEWPVYVVHNIDEALEAVGINEKT
jgi:hypothetical protein